MEAVRTDDPARANSLAADNRSCGVKTFYLPSPQRHNANLLCTLYQDPMKFGSADSQAEAARCKRRFGLKFIVQKPYAAEWGTLCASQIHADLSQCRKRIRHETFTAGLIDGRLSAIG
jgi:hypothetical protein